MPTTVSTYPFCSHIHFIIQGYGLAITGINITVMLVDALQSGQLKNYFYQNKIEIEQFHQIFSKAFLLFDHYWVEENPEDIMKFSQIFDLFKAKLLDNLKSGIISNLWLPLFTNKCPNANRLFFISALLAVKTAVWYGPAQGSALRSVQARLDFIFCRWPYGQILRYYVTDQEILKDVFEL